MTRGARQPHATHECRYCGEEFSSTYLRNVHEADECDGEDSDD
jgi:hypothetical protein